MRTRRIIIGGLLLSFALSAGQLWAAPQLKLAPGEAEVLYEFVDPNPANVPSPEGIAFDQRGNMYISLRTFGGGGILANEVLKITPRGEESVLADLGPLGPGSLGLAGLETDPQGNVYVAFTSLDPATHGVWKIHRDGTKERLAGSEKILLPDGLTMDRKGNLYVTDYDPLLMGTVGIWKYSRKEGSFAPWVDHPLVLSGGTDPLGNPMGGANGIVFDPPNHIYVSNTQRSLILHIPVMPDGSAGEVTVLAAGPPIINPDGMGVDAHGNVYVAMPTSTFPDWIWGPAGAPTLAPVVRIIPETGELQLLPDADFPDAEYFDFPTSLAFGKGPRDHKSVFVVGIGAGSYGLPFGTGPKLTQVGVGIPGQTGQ